MLGAEMLRGGTSASNVILTTFFRAGNVFLCNNQVSIYWNPEIARSLNGLTDLFGNAEHLRHD